MSSSDLPAISAATSREVDRLSGERFGVPVGWLMEAAGWQVARFARGRVAVVAGGGNNGGDGLAAARHLHRWGRLASVCCLDRGRLAGPAAEELAALEAAGVDVPDQPRLAGATCIVDAIFGTGLGRSPVGAEAAAIAAIAEARANGARVIAVDVPSGLDADSGETPGAAVTADLTVALALPKAGLLRGRGPDLAGEVWVADIGVPPGVYAALGIEVPAHAFAMHDRIQLSAVRL